MYFKCNTVQNSKESIQMWSTVTQQDIDEPVCLENKAEVEHINYDDLNTYIKRY